MNPTPCRVVIEVNDQSLRLQQDGDVCASSPGYAWIADSEVAFGAAAKSKARREPRRVESRFWDALEFEAPDRTTPLIRTQADLAYGHLKSVVETVFASREALRGAEPAIVVTPGFYDNRQTGILLGITHAMRLPVGGFLDAGVAAAAAFRRAHPGSGPVVYFDLFLHRASISHLEMKGDRVTRVGAESSVRVGGALLEAVFAQRVTELFVQQTRFDPMHDADSEQQLYDQMSAFLAKPTPDETLEISIEQGSGTHRVEVPRSALDSAAEPLLAQMFSQATAYPKARAAKADGPTACWLFSSRFRDLPGFDSALAAAQGSAKAAEVFFLDPGACLKEASLQAPTIEQSEGFSLGRVRWTTELPFVAAESVRGGEGAVGDGA